MRFRKLFALLFALALVATACGDTDEVPVTTQPPVTTTTQPDPRADWPAKIVFGFVPSQDVAELQDDVDTFAAVLSNVLGIEVEGLVTTDYTGLGVAMGTGQADLGAFGPAGYVLASRQYDNLELLAQSVRFGSPTYHGQWFTNDSSICAASPAAGAFENGPTGPVLLGPTDTVALQVGYNGDGSRDASVSEPFACEADLSKVVGKKIAFTTETSTSGFIFPTLQLQNAGITEDQYESIFAGGHDAAVTAVFNGDADIGLSFDDARRTIRREEPTVGEVVVVFNITPEIANDVIAVRAELPDSLKTALFETMTAFIKTPRGEKVMDELYSWTDLSVPDLAAIANVADAVDQLGFAD